jgi:hypothetical protein
MDIHLLKTVCKKIERWGFPLRISHTASLNIEFLQTCALKSIQKPASHMSTSLGQLSTQPGKIPSISELPLSKSDAQRFETCEFIHPSIRHSPSKSSWSNEEDDRLLNAMRGPGGIIWETIAAEVGGHTAKQCRERWLVKLNPDVRRSNFETWEDELIRRECQRIGNHWSIIAQLLPGRTACSVKNRWYTVLRHSPPTSSPFVYSPSLQSPGLVFRPNLI